MRPDADAMAHLAKLPPAITEKLLLLLRRLRRMIWLRGALAVAAVAVGSVLTVMALDAAVIIFSGALRWTLSLLSLAATAAAAYRFLYRPLSREYSMTSIARVIELRHPELQERISSSVELLAAEAKGESRGSTRLLDELVREAVVEAEAVNPRQEFSRRAVIPYAVASAVVGGSLAVLFALWPAPTARLLFRAVAPYARIGNVYAGTLTVAPGDARVGQGDPLSIGAVSTEPGVTRAELRVVRSGGREVVERMTRLPDENGRTRFAMEFPSVAESFKYRVLAGDALSAFYEVEAVPRPAAALAIRYEYPAYTGKAAYTDTNSWDIAAPVGTHVTVTARLNKPLRKADLVLNGKPAADGVETSRGGHPEKSWSFALGPEHAGPWSFNLEDAYQFNNKPEGGRITPVPDRVPTVELTAPETLSLRLKPTDVVDLQFVVRDDYGLDGVELMVGRDAAEMTTNDEAVVLRVPGKQGIWVGSDRLDLAALDLKNVQTVRVALRAADNLPPDLKGPQHGVSKTLVIQLDRNAASLAEQTLKAQREEIRKTLETVRDRVTDAKARTERTKPALATAKDVPVAAAQELEKVREQTATSENALKDLAERVQETPFASMADKMQEVQGQDIKPAREAAEEIPLTDEPTQRAARADAMQQNLEKALAGIKDLMADLDAKTRDLEELAKVDALATREDRLADQAAAATTDTVTPQWQQEQKAVAQAMAALVHADPEALAAAEKANQATAKALAQEAQQLAQAQDQMRQAVDPNQSDPAKLRAALAQELQRQQDELAHDTGALNQQTQDALKTPEKPLGEAARDTAQAAQELQGDRMDAAQTAAQQARDNLKQTAQDMAQALRTPPPENADAAAQADQRQAEAQAQQEAAQLGERQDRLLDAMKALKDGNMEQAMAALERDLGQQAKDLAADTADVQQAAQALDMGATAQREAANATEAMRNATAQTGQAAGALEHASQAPSAAQASQAEQQAAQSLTQASQALNRLGDELGRLADAAPQEPGMDPEAMTDALDQSTDAAATSATPDAAAASRAAAQSMSQLAQQTAQALGVSSPNGPRSAMAHAASQPNGQPGGKSQQSPTGTGDLPAMLKLLGISKADWVRMSGHLRSDASGATAQEAPAEYRALVKEYFREVARQGNEESK